jgi:hypothetical protein
MLTSIASLEGWSYQANQEVTGGSRFGKDTVPADMLAGWVRHQIAEPIPENRIEMATQSEPETAAVATPRPRRTRGRS